jgi:hypothetical protein
MAFQTVAVWPVAFRRRSRVGAIAPFAWSSDTRERLDH